MNTDMLY